MDKEAFTKKPPAELAALLDSVVPTEVPSAWSSIHEPSSSRSDFCVTDFLEYT
jgi:hypothetical protein